MKAYRMAACATTAVWILAIAEVMADEPPAESRPEVAVSNPEIEALLAPILEKHKVPGLVAGVVRREGLTVAGAVGVRKTGSPERITVADKLHLGSNTKAMTATLIAMLVDERKLAWQTTLAEVFVDFKSELHPDLLGATIEQLLTHRAGLPANASYRRSAGSLVDEREALLKTVLARPPVHPPGTKFLYSNVGYVAAGHALERVTGKPWEKLMSAMLFEPLNMQSAGFGFPGTEGEVDQPWGHGGLFKIPLQLDNPPVLGPAGTVHCSLADWGQFVALHLSGARGEGRLLNRETFKVLHSPPAEEKYAMGWALIDRPWAGGPVLCHSGSNAMWFATVVIAPERDIAFLAVTNSGQPSAPQACDEALAALIRHVGLITEEPETR